MTTDEMPPLAAMNETDARAWLERAGWREEGHVWVSPHGVTVVLTPQRFGFWHNVVAHPLLVLCPPLGRWLHERTSVEVASWRGRWRTRRASWARSTFGQRTV